MGRNTKLKSKEEVEKQLEDARNDEKRDPSQRTKGYIEGLEWVLEIET